jgi:voltage-gated potassium channel Kch
LSFEGNEIYFKNYTAQMGVTFGEVSLYFENAIPMGFLDPASKLVFCPPKETTVPVGSILVCMAEDDDSFASSNNKSINREIIKPIVPRIAEPENSLVIGWNNKSSLVIRELDNYAQAGSVLTILSSLDISNEVETLKNEIKNCKIEVLIGDTTDDAFLLSANLSRFQHVILLSYDHISDEDADAHTLVSLIQLRNLSNKLGTHFNIVSEMKDLRNKTLAELTKPDDFIIGNNITSLLLTQLSENSSLIDIYREIFDSSGSEIYLRPIDNYVQLGVATNFNTLVEAAMQRGEVALGFKASTISTNYGIVLNPAKQSQQTFGIGDKLIVLSM